VVALFVTDSGTPVALVAGAMVHLVQDLRFAVRTLAKSPGFTAAAVLTLALGIGANTAVFSVVRDLLLAPLQVDAPEELALVYWAAPPELRIRQIASNGAADPATGASLRSNYTYPSYREMLAAAVASGVEAAGFNFVRELSIGVGDQPAVAAGGLFADGRYFSTLRLRTVLGRPLNEGDNVVGAPPVAVLSHAFWRRVFGGDPTAVGRSIRINSVPFEIVGVSAPGFRGISRGGFFPQTEVTLPFATQPLAQQRWARNGGSLFTSDDTYWVRLLVRVPESISTEVVESRLATALRPLLPAEATSGPASPMVRLRPGARGERTSVHEEGERLLLLLNAVVAMVLLIACLNLASLMLARGMARQRELAIRRALGATQIRLMRQVLLESFLLAATGAAGGLLLTYWSSGLLTNVLTAGFGALPLSTLTMEVHIDGALLVTTAGIAMLAAVLFGLWPSLRLSRVDPGAYLKNQVVGSDATRLTMGRALIALQIAATVPLVVGAILLLRTLSNISGVTLGFDPEGIAVFRLNPEYAGVEESQYPQFYRDVLRAVEAVPGVTSATLIENALMSGLTTTNRTTIDGEERLIYLNAVGPRFFETMGMPLLAGRAPLSSDQAGSPPVAVANEAAVRQLFGGSSPIGRVVRLGTRDIEIIGVVRDSRYERQRADVRPTLFDAALQRPGFGGHKFVIKTAVPLARLAPAIRQAVASVNADLPVPELQAQTALIEEANARERLLAQLLSVFGGFALLLASIGLHGVTSYSVTRRTNEIGVRVALGAEPRQVLWLILRQVLLLAGVGLAVGVPLTMAAAPAVGALLYGVAPNDPLTIGFAAMALLAAK
jgi:predicted permease